MSKLTVETDKYGLVRVKVETTKSGTPVTYRAPANTGLSGQNDQAIAAIVDKINEMDYEDGELDTRVENIEKVIPSDTSAENQLVNESALNVLESKFLLDAGVLTDAVSVDVTNNATQQLTSAQAALTLNVNCAEGEVPNFAVEISTSAAITLTVTKTVNNVSTTLYPSEAGGTSLESGKYYQVTCVGNCWTLAEFVQPSP